MLLMLNKTAVKRLMILKSNLNGGGSDDEQEEPGGAVF